MHQGPTFQTLQEAANDFVCFAANNAVELVINAMSAGVTIAITPISTAFKIGESIAELDLKPREAIDITIGLAILGVAAPKAFAKTFYERFVL